MEPFDIIATPDGKVYMVTTMKPLDPTGWVTLLTLWDRGSYLDDDTITATHFYPSMDDALLGHKEICALLKLTGQVCLHIASPTDAIPEPIRYDLARRLIEDVTRR